MKKVINEFKTSGGKHCITTALKQVFEYYKYPLTEEMIFGIGSGLSFVYINLDKSPIVSGRTKPFEFEKKLGERLNIEINCKSSSKYKTAFDKTLKLLDDNKPVLVYADMPYLDYLNLGEDRHFGGHAVVIFGYDNETEKFYISDRDNSDNTIRTPNGYISKDYHLVDYKQVEMARSSNHRPFPANNKYLDIKFNDYKQVTSSIIFSAIKETCDNMLNAPAQLLGLNGINKFSKEILKWSKFNEEKLKIAGITNYFMINADGGTGGGIFRKMYGDFLIQASKIVSCEEMEQLGIEYITISNKWDKVGNLMWRLSETTDRQLLKEMSDIIKEIHTNETHVLTKLQEIIK
ncbi:BtrH N-terminal domain-containing protein [Clostridium frigidicarnis]|uniref:Butirosin biosynthesis protein H, N-terminal n=1 Tax=Clostridium frigidicarnis TaxID=84698 RepID=A0A1I0V3H0_9CLOT|nr:BtrH N-terminal domain-containing protein [Clostridium frigidicarnis]SFA70875.1 Butirosin biosynthesis protein H, N-terminal [Clostridium frigidicarnis]